jgi:hypothetical protein
MLARLSAAAARLSAAAARLSVAANRVYSWVICSPRDATVVTVMSEGRDANVVA